jgi:hypothetical protein
MDRGRAAATNWVPTLDDAAAVVRDDQPVDGHPRDRSGPTGVICLGTTFWALGFVWLLSRVRVELDGQRRELPWGRLRLPVSAGTHRLRVSCKYLWMDVGAATRDVDVREGQMVVLRYRAPVLVLLAGNLRLLGEEAAPPEPEPSGGLAHLAPAPWVTPGWYGDPSDGLQRRWWDGDRWTPAIFRPISSGRKAWVWSLAAAVNLPIAFVLAMVIASSLSPGPADSTGWVTVTEIEGVSFDMPRLPRHTTRDIPGTDQTFDTYEVTFDEVEMAAAVFRLERLPGDTRTDAQVLDDYAEGMAIDTGGTIADSGRADVGGELRQDLEVTTPQGGGLVILARVALVDDLLVGVQTVFEPEDREAATEAHDRMARSLDFDGEEAGAANDPSLVY